MSDHYFVFPFQEIEVELYVIGILSVKKKDKGATKNMLTIQLEIKFFLGHYKTLKIYR
jgi:hypothetical protein